MSIDQSVTEVDVSGHCYCGAIRFRVRISGGEQPIFTAYCHCDSCRRAHSAPLYQVACVEESMFNITEGEGLLEEFTKPGGTITRAFCRRCGSKVLNRFGSWRPGGRVPLVFFPSLLDEETQKSLPDALQPGKINRPEESVLNLEVLLADVEH